MYELWTLWSWFRFMKSGGYKGNFTISLTGIMISYLAAYGVLDIVVVGNILAGASGRAGFTEHSLDTKLQVGLSLLALFIAEIGHFMWLLHMRGSFRRYPGYLQKIFDLEIFEIES